MKDKWYKLRGRSSEKGTHPIPFGVEEGKGAEARTKSLCQKTTESGFSQTPKMNTNINIIININIPILNHKQILTKGEKPTIRKALVFSDSIEKRDGSLFGLSLFVGISCLANGKVTKWSGYITFGHGCYFVSFRASSLT